jgi:ribosomal protein S18 acetylase RimI-like enzyme
VTRDLQLRRADHTDLDHIAALITRAFHPLAPSQWLIPDPNQRTIVLLDYFHMWAEHALIHGHIHVLGRPTNSSFALFAAAVWFHQATGPRVDPPSCYPTRLAEACGPYTRRFQQLEATFDAHHPNQPHHHLAFLAVHPAAQNRGYGSRLLRTHHHTLDKHRLPAFLEASSQTSHDLYTRHGYRLLNSTYNLPDDGPPMWPMVRPPQPTHQSPSRRTPTF